MRKRSGKSAVETCIFADTVLLYSGLHKFTERGFRNDSEKKILSIALVLVLALTMLAGCAEKAKVIVNERTGTIVIGGNTKLMPAAIAHGGITINIQVQNEVIQPNPMAGGETALQQNAQIQITEKQASLIELEANSSLSELVSALNVIGVSPMDLIAILQALASAGSLQAEIEVI